MNSVVSSLQNTAKWSLGYGVFSRVAGRYASGMGNPYAVAASYFTSCVSEKCINKLASYVVPVSLPFTVGVALDVLKAATSTLILQGVGQMIDPEFNCMTIAKINLLGGYMLCLGLMTGAAVNYCISESQASAPDHRCGKTHPDCPLHGYKEGAPKPVEEKEPAPQSERLGSARSVAMTALPLLAVEYLPKILGDIVLGNRTISTFWQEECYFISKAGGHMMDHARIICDYADKEKGSWLNSLQGDVFKFALYAAVFKIGVRAIVTLMAERKSESDVAKNETSQKGSSQVATVS